MEHTGTDNRTRIDIAVILAAVLLAAASLSLIGDLRVDSSTDAFIPQQAEVVFINRDIEREFGSMDAMMVGILVNEGTVLNEKTLNTIDSLTRQFAIIEGVDSVTSLTNTDHMQSNDEGLEVVPLYKGTSAEGISRLAERLNQWPEVYEGNLISFDRTMAAIIIQPASTLPQEGEDTVLDRITAIIASTPSDGTEFSIVGLPVVKNQINQSLVSDMAVLAPIAGLLIILVLFLAFRRLAGVLLPLVGLVISACITVGIMALFDITFTMATMLVPVLLLIVGSAYAIHVMSHFYEEVARRKCQLDPAETRQVIDEVLHRNRMPIIMAGATTAAGFLAQLASPLAPFRTFGSLSVVGVVLSQLSSLYLLPAMLRITYRNGIDPARIHIERDRQRESKSHPLFGLFERIATRGSGPLLIISLVLAVTTILLVPGISTGTNMLDFFKPSSRLVQDTRRFNEKMNGSGVLTVMIDGNKPSSVLDPSFLASLDGFASSLSEHPAVGKVQTVTPYVKRINTIMNRDTIPYRAKVKEQPEFDFFGDMPDMEHAGEFGRIVTTREPSELWDAQTFNEIPSDPAKYGLETSEDLKNLISQYLLLYSGNLGMFINDALEPSATLVTIQLKTTDTAALREVTSAVSDYWDRHLQPGWKVSIGGGEAISLALTDLVTRSQIYSLAGALVIVWLLVSLIFRSPVAGLIGLIPVVFALMGIFSFMAIFSINLDIITSLLAALAIGIGVDYSIHFMSAYTRLSGTTDSHQVLPLVMRTTGRAIIINAASVILGFSGLIFSRFIPIQQMGMLFCVSMIFAGLSSLTVLPMVLDRWQPRFLHAGTPPATKQTDTNRRNTP